MSEEETDWAWLAGFFDGEGSTQILKSSLYAVNVVIGQNDIRPLERAKAIAGGSITGPYKYGNSNSKPHYRWVLSSYDTCVSVLERMWPYLSEPKKEQAVKAFIQRELGRLEAGKGQ